MPRSKNGVKRPPVNPEKLKQAIEAVTRDDHTVISLNEAVRVYGVSKSTLQRHAAAHRENAENAGEYEYSSNLDVRKVFSPEEESELANYIQTVARMHYGLTKQRVRELAYKYAEANHKKMPPNWERDQCAGEEWMRYFMKRNPQLSVRKPEQTSLARSAGFNQTNVGKFFDNLKDIHQRFGPIPASRIWNADESGCTTVPNPPLILATKGEKQVGSITTGERGQLITIICAINAIGNHTPPFMIFPRVKYHDYMIAGAPAGSEGSATPSGWSNEEQFVKFLKFCMPHMNPTREQPVLLIMDNHESHRSIEAINFAKENGIILLTFPPHCTHRIQPLDTHVFGSFKTHYNNALNGWHIDNPGKSYTIYNVAKTVGTAFPHSFSTSNICNGFRDTGISPLDEHIFDNEVNFLPAFVSDQPEPIQQLDTTPPNVEPSANVPLTSANGSSRVSPEDVRPYPKAELRKTTRGKRRHGKTQILTDTPEKEVIERQKSAKKMKKQPKKKRAVRKLHVPETETTNSDQENYPAPKKPASRNKRTKTVENNESSDDDDVGVAALIDSESENASSSSDESQSELEELPLQIGDYVLTRVFTEKRKSERYFISQIRAIVTGGFKVKWFKRIKNTNKFVESNEENNFIPTIDVVKKMISPTRPASSRFRKALAFDLEDRYDFSLF